MGFAPTYLLYRFFYRIYEFFHHWYFDSSKAFLNWLVDFFQTLDQTFALGVTAKHFFQPLYKDYTAVGRILGVIFRSGRIIVAVATYVFLGICFFAAYFLWLAIPQFLIVYALGF